MKVPFRKRQLPERLRSGEWELAPVRKGSRRRGTGRRSVGGRRQSVGDRMSKSMGRPRVEEQRRPRKEEAPMAVDAIVGGRGDAEDVFADGMVEHEELQEQSVGGRGQSVGDRMLEPVETTEGGPIVEEERREEEEPMAVDTIVDGRGDVGGAEDVFADWVVEHEELQEQSVGGRGQSVGDRTLESVETTAGGPVVEEERREEEEPMAVDTIVDSSATDGREDIGGAENVLEDRVVEHRERQEESMGGRGQSVGDRMLESVQTVEETRVEERMTIRTIVDATTLRKLQTVLQCLGASKSGTKMELIQRIYSSFGEIRNLFFVDNGRWSGLCRAVRDVGHFDAILPPRRPGWLLAGNFNYLEVGRAEKAFNLFKSSPEIRAAVEETRLSAMLTSPLGILGSVSHIVAEIRTVCGLLPCGTVESRLIRGMSMTDFLVFILNALALSTHEEEISEPGESGVNYYSCLHSLAEHKDAIQKKDSSAWECDCGFRPCRWAWPPSSWLDGYEELDTWPPDDADEQDCPKFRYALYTRNCVRGQEAIRFGTCFYMYILFMVPGGVITPFLPTRLRRRMVSSSSESDSK